MSKKTTIVLLVLALCLGAYIVFVDRGLLATDERDALARKAVMINPSAVDRIVIEPREGAPFGAELRQGAWHMNSPTGARADAGRISRLLQKLDRMRQTSVISAEERATRGLGWGDYGLSPAEYRLRLFSKDDSLELWFGTGGVTNRFPVYLRRVGSDDILRVDDDTLAAIPASSMDLRDHQIFRREAEESVRLELSRASGFVHLERDAGGRWRMEQPVRTSANAEAVAKLLDLLHTLRIEKFVSDNDTGAARYGFDETSPYIRVFHEGADFPVKLTVGARLSDDPRQAYARLEGMSAIFTVAEGLRQLTEFEIDALRDRQVLSLPPERLQTIRFSRPGGASVTLRRGEGGGWTLSDPKAWPADAERIVATLSSWYAAQASAFLPASAPEVVAAQARPPLLEAEFATDPSAQPDGTVRGETRTLRLHELEGNPAGLLVHSLPDNTWQTVVPADLRATHSDVLHYRDREVLRLVANDLREIIRKENGGETSVSREDPSHPWQSPAGTPDPDAISGLLKALAPLRAERLVEFEPASLAPHGLDSPRITLTLGLAGETGISRSLVIGVPGPDGTVRAIIRGQDLVFTLPRETLRWLAAPLLKPPTGDAGTPSAVPAP